MGKSSQVIWTYNQGQEIPVLLFPDKETESEKLGVLTNRATRNRTQAS